MALRKTKIVCTMGPAVHNIESVKQLLIEGMNIARFNFSHGDHAYHQETVSMVREASRQTGIPAALMLDTKGPEIRTGQTKENCLIQLENGKSVILATDDAECTPERIAISYQNLPQEISPGKHVYIADGVIDLLVERVEGNHIHCRILQGGEIGSRKNINVVGVRTALPAITEKDEEDILFGIQQNFDFIAASFIRKGSDVLEIRKLLDAHNSKIHIIAKIEDEEGVENIDEILAVSNGIMVARGDLGVQLKTEEIPLVQKRIIRRCNAANKPVITATQMLDSMIQHPRPTRAEASDVANAIFDGTDAVMLSGETASGAYPILAVKTMHNIAVSVENSAEYREKIRSYVREIEEENNMATAIAQSAFLLAENIHATAILTPTLRGNTPKLVSKYRPQQAIIAPTPSNQVQRNLLLYWGVYPIIAELVSESDDMLSNALTTALRKKYLRNDDRVITVAGIPINSPIMLNTIRVHIISTVLAKGAAGFGKLCTGKIVKAMNLSDAALKIQGTGQEILLTKMVDATFRPLFPKIRGLIVEEPTSISDDEFRMFNQNLVVIAGVPDAIATFEHELIVSMDGEEHLIYEGVVEEREDALEEQQREIHGEAI